MYFGFRMIAMNRSATTALLVPVEGRPLRRYAPGAGAAEAHDKTSHLGRVLFNSPIIRPLSRESTSNYHDFRQGP